MQLRLRKKDYLEKNRIDINSINEFIKNNTYAYGTSKDLINDKEQIKCSNIIKQYKKWLALWYCKRKRT